LFHGNEPVLILRLGSWFLGLGLRSWDSSKFLSKAKDPRPKT
jgi:hypothetical protein